MIIIEVERPFKTARARNEMYVKIENAIYLCSELQDLETLKEEYKTELQNIKKHDEMSPNQPAPIYELLIEIFNQQKQKIEENIWQL